MAETEGINKGTTERNIVTLLNIFRDYYFNNHKGEYGLCIVLGILNHSNTITCVEFKLLYDYLKNNIPEDSFKDMSHWYLIKDFESRIKWFDKHIKLNS